MELIQIKNVSETAYRFSPILKFLPGETVTVSKKEVDAKPVINLLIKAGRLQIVGAQASTKEVAGDTEVVEEV